MKVFAIVGPSGAGKDSVIEALRPRLGDLEILQRVITRPARSGDEPFEGVDDATFSARHAAGEFALAWQAHGLRYGIPRPKGTGNILFNGSRKGVAEASVVFPNLEVIHITCDPHILADRLARRGREAEAQIALRLSRDAPLPAHLRVHLVDNSGDLNVAVAAVIRILRDT